MKKRIIMVLMAAALMLIAIGCHVVEEEKEDKKYILTYIAKEGGNIIGETSQIVKEGDNGESVTAEAKTGYEFKGWSDGEESAVRMDQAISGDIKVYACFEQQEYIVEYSAGDGGYLVGDSKQTIASGGETTVVTAKAQFGCEFASWSDGVTTATRQEKDVRENIKVEASFIKSKQIFTYEYNGATEGNEEDEIIVESEKIRGTKFAVPEREGFAFQGWYLDKEFTPIKKAANRMGQALMGKEMLEGSEGKLYAKWIEEETIVYPILMVFVTDVEGEFIGQEGQTIKVDYKMPELQRKICEMIPEMLSEELNEILKGIAVCELDTYFTERTVNQDSFETFSTVDDKKTYSLFPYTMGEVTPLLPYYRSVANTVSQNDYEQELHRGSGEAQAKYATVHLDSMFVGIINKESSMEKLLDKNHMNWPSYMQLYVHELIHSMEQNYPYEELFQLHSVGNYYEREKQYLRCEYMNDGVACGIPRDYWSGNLELVVRYSCVDLERKDWGGGNIIIKGESVSINVTHHLDGIPYGSDLPEIEVIASEGYEFVCWSDGITSPIRQDKNITGYTMLYALFRKI
jgi:S-layer domain protein